MKKGIAFVLTVALLATLATGCASSVAVAEPTIEPVLSATAEPTVQQNAAQEESVSIVDAKVNENGELILYMSNNTTINAGLVRGEDGKDGVDGLNGADGKDGVNGKNGRDGVDGKDGADGKDGRDGIDGTNGRDGVDGKDGKDGKDGQNASSGDSRKIELKNDGTNVCWRYEGDSEWQTLISLADITGKDGKDGAPGKDGADGKDGKDGIDGAPGKDGADGKDGKDGIDGADGKDGADGAPGKDGVDGAPGKDGADGADGQPGADGREVELRTTETHIQWRYVGDTEWKDLIALSEITGPKGDVPTIGDNGNWWIGGEDTGISAANKEQNFLYAKDGTTLVGYVGDDTRVFIPGHTRAIGYRAFAGREDIVSVKIPSCVNSIAGEAFIGCESLKEITFEEGNERVKRDISIGNRSFEGCVSLEKLILPKIGVNSVMIGSEAFKYNHKLTTIEITASSGDSYLSGIQIATGAFSNCESLVNLKLHIPVSEHGGNELWNALKVNKDPVYNCPKLKVVNIPQKFDGEEKDDFYFCDEKGNLHRASIKKNIYDCLEDMKIYKMNWDNSLELIKEQNKTNAISFFYNYSEFENRTWMDDKKGKFYIFSCTFRDELVDYYGGELEHIGVAIDGEVIAFDPTDEIAAEKIAIVGNTVYIPMELPSRSFKKDMKIVVFSEGKENERSLTVQEEIKVTINGNAIQ